jgi:serine/threonine-protein kinase
VRGKDGQVLAALAGRAGGELAAADVVNLAQDLRQLGQEGAAVALLRRGRERYPDDFWLNHDLGRALVKQEGKSGAGVPYLMVAAALRPLSPDTHLNLGHALAAKGDTDGAIRCYTKALDLDPRFALGHYNLGQALYDKGDTDGAIRCYTKALDLDPKLAEAHYNLVLSLLGRGDFAAARAATRRCLDLLPPRHPLHNTVEQQLRLCEAGLALSEKLPAVLSGQARPAGAAEALQLALLCQRHKQLHAAASRLFADAFAAEPKLAEDLDAQHCYNAACSAALAAAGQGKDADKLDAQERARWRKQALDWLRADLQAWRKILDQGKPPQRAAALQALRHWQQDADLAGLRDEKALAGLPGDERDACRKLWADVAALVHKVTPPP